MNDLDININSMVEYIEILVSLAIEKKLDSYIEELDFLKNKIENAKSMEEIEYLKEKLRELDIKIEKEAKPLSSREEALVERGYSREDVIRLTSFTEEELQEKKNLIIDRITEECEKVKNPICIYIGGQPGSGKTTVARKIKNSDTSSGLVYVSLDNYRSYHPNYFEIEDVIKEHWKDKEETNNDTMGNDIADFTHSFAGRMSDEILDELSTKNDNKAYNIILEWGMRTPDEPLNRIKNMKEEGYTNVVDFVMVHKDTSKEACKIRADVMNDFSHIIRRVPDYFHEMCVTTLPESAKKIYEVGFKERNDIDQFILSTRDNKIVWDHNNNEEDLEEIYKKYLEDKSLSNEYNNSLLAIESYKEEEKGFQDEIESMLKSADEETEQDIIRTQKN